MYLKEYNSESGLLVAVCDRDLLGKCFEEGELSLKISERFYKGKEATEGDVLTSLQRATIANLVGKRTITCAVDNDFIDEACVIFVDGIPHAQMVKL
jgi:hypothetical protein